jgi:hypothetical protein
VIRRLLLGVLLAAPQVAPLQQLAGQPLAGQAPGSELKVTLLTYETGGLLYERFGHNALLLEDQSTGERLHYDYGRFDFNEKNFLLKFASGKMWYSMGQDSDPDKYLRAYAGEGRKIWAQELELSPLQRQALREFLTWNSRPENAGYAYDYYRDNCSTRIRDALDQVLGGVIRSYGESPSGFTWREETRRLNQHNPVIYSGLALALGRPVDIGMSRWEQMFLPVRLRQHLDSVQVTGADGITRPLVKSSRVLAEGGRWPVPDRPASWTLRYLIAGVVLGAVLALTGRRKGLRSTVYLAAAELWVLVAGIAGMLLTLLALSQHRAAHQNENLLLFNLLALALAFLLPAAVRRGGRAGNAARRLALVVLAVAALDLVLKLLPGAAQQNAELLAFALPAHAGVWLGLRTPELS